MGVIKPQGFALLAICVAFITAAILGLIGIESPVRLVKSQDEIRAAQVAAAFVAQHPSHRYAAKQVPGVFDKWGNWVVTFAPACSYSGKAGPMVEVSKATFQVTAISASDAACGDDGTAWWERPESDR
jgi:hypothetical protein